MVDTLQLVLATIVALLTWSATLVAAVIWINGKFRSMEETVYREFDRRRKEYNRDRNGHELEIQRLNLKVFGFTQMPLVPPESSEDRSSDRYSQP